MLTFTGADGVEWRVWEVSGPHTAAMPALLVRRPEFARGWLLFDSGEERRRLAPFPANWRTLSVRELERCCSEAEPVRVGAAPAPPLDRAG